MENENILCDNCGRSHEGTFFTAQQDFEGCEILAALEVISHKILPNNLAVKQCLMCTAQLISTMCVVQKVQKMVEKLLSDKANAENKEKAAEKERDNKNPIVEVTASTSTPREPTTQERIPFVTIEIKMEQPDEEPIVDVSASTSVPKKPTDDASEVNKIIIKQEEPDEEEEIVDQPPVVDLTAIKLTIPERIQALGTAYDLFFPRYQIPIQPVDNSPQRISMFHCKYCPFQGNTEEQLKNHLIDKHGKKRPRVYFCDVCPSSFGILESLWTHNRNVHGNNVRAPQHQVARVPQAPREPTVLQTPREPRVYQIPIEPTKKYYADKTTNTDNTFQQIKREVKTEHGSVVCPNCGTCVSTNQVKVKKEEREDVKEEEVEGNREDDDCIIIRETGLDTIVIKDEIEDEQPPKRVRSQAVSGFIEGDSTARDLKCPGCETICSTKNHYINHLEGCKARGHMYPCGLPNCRSIFYNTHFLWKHLTLDHNCP